MQRRVIAVVVAVAAAWARAVAAQPEPRTAEPEPRTAEPEPRTAEPEPRTAEPEPRTAEPEPRAPEPEPEPEAAADSIGDQLIGGAIGVAAGGRTTAGGFRVTGHYLYQLSDEDWFDGIASFTFGGGGAGCFRDRSDALVCDHGLASGTAIELAAGVRRMFAAQGRFRPFARAAVGIAVVRFGGDDLTGFAIPAHAAAGLRATISADVAVFALADASLGIARFGRGLGVEPQLGLAVTAGAEVRLR